MLEFSVLSWREASSRLQRKGLSLPFLSGLTGASRDSHSSSFSLESYTQVQGRDDEPDLPSYHIVPVTVIYISTLRTLASGLRIETHSWVNSSENSRLPRLPSRLMSCWVEKLFWAGPTSPTPHHQATDLIKKSSQSQGLSSPFNLVWREDS